MNTVALTISQVLKTRTAQAALLGAATHISAALAPKLGFPVEVQDVANGLGALIDLIAVTYFRMQAPVRDQQNVVTPRPN